MSMDERKPSSAITRAFGRTYHYSTVFCDAVRDQGASTVAHPGRTVRAGCNAAISGHALLCAPV